MILMIMNLRIYRSLEIQHVYRPTVVLLLAVGRTLLLLRLDFQAIRLSIVTERPSDGHCLGTLDDTVIIFLLQSNSPAPY